MIEALVLAGAFLLLLGWMFKKMNDSMNEPSA